MIKETSSHGIERYLEEIMIKCVRHVNVGFYSKVIACKHNCVFGMHCSSHSQKLCAALSTPMHCVYFKKIYEKKDQKRNNKHMWMALDKIKEIVEIMEVHS